ncbi:hypothetical protein ABW19_dt0206301 [Dactylella cylindrospora]|nr:hypothetical protein ABW19_dt0206301 [Dactylella cylindrospora]
MADELQTSAAAVPKTSYLLSYLQKSDLFTSQNPSSLEAQGINLNRFSLGSTGSLRSSSPTTSSHDGDVDEDDYDDYDDDDEDYGVDPDDLTNLPYKSPAVYQLPGSGNGNKFRTLVRDGPVGSAQGENERFVVIGKRSFRGAGLWPGELVGVVVPEVDGMEVDIDAGSDDEDEERLDGEVEVMWADDGEEFWLVRDPMEDGSIGRETSWVSKEWFLEKRKAARDGKATGRQTVELRVMMEED